MDGVDLRAYLLALTPRGQESLRGVLKRDRVIRRSLPAGTLDNAAWLCAFHHWLVHQGQWVLERDPADKSYLWTGPHGQQQRRHLSTA